MKKLTVLLVVIMLVASLLAGCGIIPGSRLWKIEVGAIEGEGNPTIGPDWVDFNGPGQTVQLEVAAYYDDGTSADVTLECDYISSAPEVATVEIIDCIVQIEAIARANGEGYATILVTYTQNNFWTSDITRIAKVEVVY